MGEIEVGEAQLKRVIITLTDRNKPEIEFEGDFTGRDIMVISSHLHRAYQRDRREKIKKAKEIEKEE